MPRLPRQVIEQQLARLPLLRNTCAACDGRPERCQQGQANGDRLPGCAAFTAQGTVKPLPLTVVGGDKRQPWQPRQAA